MLTNPFIFIYFGIGFIQLKLLSDTDVLLNKLHKRPEVRVSLLQKKEDTPPQVGETASAQDAINISYIKHNFLNIHPHTIILCFV